MCGICGLVSFGGTRVDPDVLHAMNETLVHRGPDSAGAFVDGPVGLAVVRIQDEKAPCGKLERVLKDGQRRGDEAEG